MKFCYLDESGTGGSSYPVMFGVIVDARRMHLTKNNWSEVLAILSDAIGREIREFHARNFYAGNGIWRNIEGRDRARIIIRLLEWFESRGHHVVHSAVDRAQFDANFHAHRFSADVGSLWRLLALHIVLSLQKCHQRVQRNKGNTVLIFDEQVMEKTPFTKLVCNPPDWTETYYNRAPGQLHFDQIVDVPHFVDSEQVLLIQVADLMTLILRRHLELEEGGELENYAGERTQISDWTERIMGRSINRSMMYPRRNLCEAAIYFRGFVPNYLWP